MPKPNIVFAGSPEFAAAILDVLLHSNNPPKAVFTQPDRAKGRGRKPSPNPVKKLALSHGLPVEQPASLKGKDVITQLAQYEPDLLVVAAYGLILPQAILDTPRLACLNVHASLLPRWRGAAPIERAAMAGDERTGVCIMHMEAGLDTGPVYRCADLDIDYTRSIAKLEEDLAGLGAKTLLEVIDEFELATTVKGTASKDKNKAKRANNKKPTNLPRPDPQDHGLATYADKLTAADRQIDWHRSAQMIHQQIWALAERLPARATVGGTGIQIIESTPKEQTQGLQNTAEPGTIVDVTRAGITIQCATDMLQIKKLKVEKGKGAVLDAAAAVNGYANLFRTGARVAPVQLGSASS